MSFGAKMSDPTLSRRDFLKLARTALLTASGIIGLGGLLRFLSYQTEPPAPTEFDLGPTKDYAPGSRTLLPQVPAVLFRSDIGFSALSLVCPHLGCTVASQTEGFACPCHGSRFDSQGRLVRGPAAKSLTALRVETASDGHLHLFTN
jgi:cytochrome b6-f complex iron-sulfur subunit